MIWPWGPRLIGLWLGHLPRLLAAALFFLSLPGLGGFLLRRLGLDRWRSFFVDSGAALVFWAILGFLLAAAGLSQPRTLQAVSIILCAAGLTLFPRQLMRRLVLPNDLPSRLLILGLSLVGVLLLLSTLVPDTFYDALAYHLAVPQLYLQTGRLTDQPDNHLTRLPGLIQTLNLWGLAWSDDRLCKLLNLGFFTLMIAAPAAWLGRRVSRRAGLWAALMMASCPLFVVNAWSCTNDLLCGFFFFLSLSLWMETGDGPEAPQSGAMLAGFFFGAAAAVKYTALFAAPFFMLEFILRGLREPKRTFSFAMAFGAGAVFPLLPWWLRTGFWTGNPFFPKATAILGGAAPEDLSLLNGWADTLRFEGSFWTRLLSLFQESLTGVQHGRFGFLGPALIMTLALMLFLRDRKSLQPLMLCAVVSYTFFAASSGRSRYFIPQLPLFFIMGAVCLEDYLNAGASAPFSGGRWNPTNPGHWLQASLAAVVMLNLFWLVLVFQRYDQGWGVIWGRESERDYLRAEHIGVYGHPTQRAFDYVSAHNEGGKIFLIGEARTFRSPLPTRAAGAFNVPTYARWEQEAPTPDAFLEKLRAAGFSYLLVNVPEMKRVTPEPYRTDADIRLLGAVFDRLAPPLYRDQWTILFKIPQVT